MDWFHHASATAAPAAAPAPTPTSTAHEPTVFEHLTHGAQTNVTDYANAIRHDGLRGVIGDRDAAVDRAGARRELAPMFTVRDANAPLDRLTGLTNTITPEEFETVSRTYSDIRRSSTRDASGHARGSSHLRVDTDHVKPEFQQPVRDDTMRDIANIMQTRSGRELVESLAHPTATTERPVHDTVIYERGDVDNANAYEATAKTYAPKVGCDAGVSYASGPQGGIRGKGDDEWRNMRSDVTLYHELTHAYHLTRGTNAEGQMNTKENKGGWYGDNGEDNDEAQAAGLANFRATTINENRYRAERKEVGVSGVGVREEMVDDAGYILAGDNQLRQREHYRWSYAPETPPTTPLPVVHKPSTTVEKDPRQH